ncbi:MAG TPA: hypothetical protein VF669_01060 [Tepidisphaeraceae bacterium]|jgi:hypothetical protein
MNRLCVIFLICSVAGCGGGGSDRPAQRALSKSDLETLRQEFNGQSSGGAVQIGKTYPVTRGKLPLAYITTGGSVIRVVDMSNGVAIATADALARSVVAVDEKKGVTVGGSTVMPGPLASAHEYGIYVENHADTQVQVRTGAITPPATAPAR